MKCKVKKLYFELKSFLDDVPREDIDIPDNIIPIGSGVEYLYSGSGEGQSKRCFWISFLEPIAGSNFPLTCGSCGKKHSPDEPCGIVTRPMSSDVGSP